VVNNNIILSIYLSEFQPVHAPASSDHPHAQARIRPRFAGSTITHNAGLAPMHFGFSLILQCGTPSTAPHSAVGTAGDGLLVFGLGIATC